MWLVYVHINQVNGLAYVGITSRKPKLRWGYEGCGYKPDKNDSQNRHFWNAIQKYGWNSFSHKILEQNLTKEEANELEIYYIKQFDSYNNGYNSTTGGKGTNGMRHSDEVKERMSQKRKGKKHSKEWCEHIRKSLICNRKVLCLETGKIYDSPLECARELNIDDSNILAICRGVHISLKKLHFQFADEPIKTIEEIEANRKKSSQIRQVICFETGIIYESINECSRQTGINRRNVQRACKIYTSANGYHFKFKDDETTLQEIIEFNKKNLTRKIECIETGMIFNSLRECADYFGLKSTGNICSTCSGKQKTFKGYHLRYVSEQDNRIKKVLCIEDNIIFETQAECAKHYGIGRSTMNMLCNKQKESYNGLHFQFLEYDVPTPVKGTSSKNKKIKCLETNIIYTSKAECAKLMNISPSNLSAVLNKRGRKAVNGYHFEYFEENSM